MRRCRQLSGRRLNASEGGLLVGLEDSGGRWLGSCAYSRRCCPILVAQDDGAAAIVMGSSMLTYPKQWKNKLTLLVEEETGIVSETTGLKPNQGLTRPPPSWRPRLGYRMGGYPHGETYRFITQLPCFLSQEGDTSNLPG